MRLLAGKDAAGLGLAVGLIAELPPALIDEAETRGLPLFELPFDLLAFIAITEWASTRLINEGYQALERSVEVHALLEGSCSPSVARDHARTSPNCLGAATRTIAASSPRYIRRSGSRRAASTSTPRSTSGPRPAGRRCS